MRTAQLGRSGPQISRVGMGTWQASGSGSWGYGPRSDDDQALAAIRRAVESGVSWVDTAASYGLGHSEQIVRRALEPWKVGEDVLLFTKCGHPWDPPQGIRSDLDPASIKRECEGSLRRLGVERIDLYQFHHPDPSTPVEESWSAMAELIDEGKVRWGGVSNFDVSLHERCEVIRHVDCSQPELNLLSREALGDVVPWCQRNGTGVIVYSPIATGGLSGVSDEERLGSLPSDDWRWRFATSTNFEVDRLRSLAEGVGVTISALAVAWTLSKAGVSGAICGARLPDQVDGWIPAADLDLEPDVIAELEAITEAGSQAN